MIGNGNFPEYIVIVQQPIIVIIEIANINYVVISILYMAVSTINSPVFFVNHCTY